jgi:NAD(P)H dehydrogenase (quinone)
MTQPRILVTSAAGKTGAALVAELCRCNLPVRALVHRSDSRSAALARLGAEVVVGDLFDSSQLLDALRDVQRAYWCPPFHPHMLEAATGFAVAARESRLESVVGLSQWLSSPDHPSLATRQHWLADQLLAAIPGMRYTVLNPGFFADNYLRLIPFAAHLGVLPSLTADSLNAPPSNEDIARTAAAILLHPDRFTAASYRPTGPALMSTAQMAEVLSRVLGRTVRRVEMPWFLFLRAARMQGVSAFELSGFRYYVADHLQGAFAHGAPNDVVATLTGQAPESFETLARRYAALPFARRTAGSRLKAWFDFMRTPMMPGYDLDRYDANLGCHQPASPRLALDSTNWKATHACLLTHGNASPVL